MTGPERDDSRRGGDDGTLEEPPNSTVDDWIGQKVKRDQDLADEVMEEAGGDSDKAEELFDARSAGREPRADQHSSRRQD